MDSNAWQTLLESIQEDHSTDIAAPPCVLRASSVTWRPRKNELCRHRQPSLNIRSRVPLVAYMIPDDCHDCEQRYRATVVPYNRVPELCATTDVTVAVRTLFATDTYVASMPYTATWFSHALMPMAWSMLCQRGFSATARSRVSSLRTLDMVCCIATSPYPC